MSKAGPEGYFVNPITLIQATDGSSAALVQTNLPDHLARPLLGTDARKVHLSPQANALFGSGEPTQSSRTFSLANAWDSRDRNKATWEPAGPASRGVNPADSGQSEVGGVESTQEVPAWQVVLDTPGFLASWERARAQAKAGQEVPQGEIDKLQED